VLPPLGTATFKVPHKKSANLAIRALQDFVKLNPNEAAKITNVRFLVKGAGMKAFQETLEAGLNEIEKHLDTLVQGAIEIDFASFSLKQIEALYRQAKKEVVKGGVAYEKQAVCQTIIDYVEEEIIKQMSSSVEDALRGALIKGKGEPLTAKDIYQTIPEDFHDNKNIIRSIFEHLKSQSSPKDIHYNAALDAILKDE